MNTEEKWLVIPGYNFYEVSSLGRVRSKDRFISPINAKAYFKKGKLLKLIKNPDGYLYVNLSYKNKKKHWYIHRLVAISFMENPQNKPEINHLNGVKTDNRIVNLEWSTSLENSLHAVHNGLYNDISKLVNSRKVINTKTGVCYSSIKDAALALNRNYTVVREMLKGRRKNTISLEYIN